MRKNNVVQTEWTLNQQVLFQVFIIWGTPHTNLFATRLNKRLLEFVSPVLAPEPYATDAMSLIWKGMWAYPFPPFPLILPSLRKSQLEAFWCVSKLLFGKAKHVFFFSSHVTSCSSRHLSTLGQRPSFPASVTQIILHSRVILLSHLAAMQQHMEALGFS